MKSAFLSSVVAPFAHLTGRAKAEESDEDRKKREDEEKAKRAEDEKKEKEAKSKTEDESDEDKKKREDEEKAKKAGKNCDDEEEMKAAARASGIQAERTRWVATLGNPISGGRVEAAVTLLATSDLSSEQIVSTLKSLPAIEANSRAGIDGRMARTEIPNPGAGGGSSTAEGPAATAKAMMAVYDKVTGRAK